MKFYHREVDFILEAGMRMVGIEVKAASTLTKEHFKGLLHLKNEVGDRFHRGIVLYTGNQIGSFGEDLWAIPISGLWERK